MKRSRASLPGFFLLAFLLAAGLQPPRNSNVWSSWRWAGGPSWGRVARNAACRRGSSATKTQATWVRWRSEAGWRRALQILQELQPDRYDARRMDWSWWQENICNDTSKIDVTCQECGHRSRDTMLRNLRSGQSPGCFCNGGVRWSSREGHARCLELLRDRHGERYDASRMDWSWWQENICNATSKIDVTCQECGHRSRDTMLGNLRSGQSPGCFCNGGVRWSSREGHARCLELLTNRHGERYDASRMDWSWWHRNIDNANSKIDVTCQECGHRSRDTWLRSLQSGHPPGCLCARKTEGKLMQWLLETFAGCTAQVPGCVNPKTQRSLPFDFGLCNDTVLIELDGAIGHFGRGWGGAADDGGVPRRDLFKEQWALRQGKAVIRLLQADVYMDCWNWKDFLTAAVQHAIRNSDPFVLTQDAPPYRDGIYRKLRQGIPCQVGSFQPTHDVSIPYLAYGAEGGEKSHVALSTGSER